MRTMTMLGTGALLLGWGAAAQAKNLKIASVEASSTYPEANGVSYEPTLLSDSKSVTAWFEGKTGSGLGESVTLHLDGEQTVTGVRLWAGWWSDGEQWGANNRPHEVELSFSDGSTKSVSLTDKMELQEIRLDKPVRTSSVRVKIVSIYNGSAFNDTGISEIQVFNDEGDGLIRASAFGASSTYDQYYSAPLMQDGVLDTMWCEGSKAGDGTGEWVELILPSSTQVSALVLNNGHAGGLRENMRANRAKSATLTFSDGSTEQVVLKPSPLTQTITFSPRSTSKVRITFNEVVKGSEFNDLCISEAYLK